MEAERGRFLLLNERDTEDEDEDEGEDDEQASEEDEEEEEEGFIPRRVGRDLLQEAGEEAEEDVQETGSLVCIDVVYEDRADVC